MILSAPLYYGVDGLRFADLFPGLRKWISATATWAPLHIANGPFSYSMSDFIREAEYNDAFPAASYIEVRRIGRLRARGFFAIWPTVFVF